MSISLGIVKFLSRLNGLGVVLDSKLTFKLNMEARVVKAFLCQKLNIRTRMGTNARDEKVNLLGQTNYQSIPQHYFYSFSKSVDFCILTCMTLTSYELF